MDEYTLIDSEVNEQPEDNSRPWNMELKTFCMLMHLSQFGSMLVPGAGLVLQLGTRLPAPPAGFEASR